MMKLRNYIFAAVGLIFACAPAMAQDYYDDIYGSPKREKKQKQQPSYTPAADYAPADSYTVTGTSTRDVDEYNRHGQFLVADTVPADTVGTGDTFAYTRRIEQFHNPNVVTESGDTTLCDYYYSSPVQNVNLYVVNADPYYYPYSWAWRYGSPWYWNVYGPAYVGWGGWSWGWYDPFWDPYPWGWSWGWTWTPGWGGWGPGWGPGWGGGWAPSHAWRPSSPGASRPHRPSVGNGYNAVHNGAASNHFAGSNNGRPGNSGRPNYGGNYNGNVNSAAGLRPGFTSTTGGTSTARPGTRPNASQGTYTPYGAGTRGRGSATVGGSTVTPRNNSSTTTNRVYNSNTNNNYNRNSNNSSRQSYGSGSSRSSFGSGGGGSHSTRGGGGGASRGGGGGGGRGRR